MLLLIGSVDVTVLVELIHCLVRWSSTWEMAIRLAAADDVICSYVVLSFPLGYLGLDLGLNCINS